MQDIPSPFTQEEGHHAAHEDNGDHSQSEVQEEGPRGGQGVHPVKNGAIFWEAGGHGRHGPKRHQRKQIECVHSRKLNMELKTLEIWQMIFMFRREYKKLRNFLLEQSDETLSWVQSKSVQNELLKSMKKWVVSV